MTRALLALALLLGAALLVRPRRAEAEPEQMWIG